MLTLLLAQAWSNALSETGAFVYEPKASWVRQSQFRLGDLRMDLYSTSNLGAAGQPIWIQTRLTNLGHSDLMLPRIDQPGGFCASSYVQLSQGSKPLYWIGDNATPAVQTVFDEVIEESRFFRLPAGQSVVLRTDAIRKVWQFPEGRTGGQKDDYSVGKQVMLKPGTYGIKVHYHINRPIMGSGIFEYEEARGKSPEWIANLPAGHWRAKMNFTVQPISPGRSD